MTFSISICPTTNRKEVKHESFNERHNRWETVYYSLHQIGATPDMEDSEIIALAKKV